MVATGGQLGDSPKFIPVLSKVGMARPGSGRPRSRPQQVLANTAYTSTANRPYLRRRGIKACIPSKADQDAHRLAKDQRAVDHQPSTRSPAASATSWSAA